MFARHKVQKSITLLLSLITVFSLAACGTPSKLNTDNSVQTSVQGSTIDTGKVDLPEYEILFLCSANNPVNIKKSTDTKIGKIIKDKFNIVFKFENYQGNWDEKLALMLAANDYPEMLNLTSANMITKYTNAKAAIPLDEIINKYGKTFAERNKDIIPYWKMLADDGKIYHYEFMAPNSQCVTAPRNDILIRSDVLEALGYPELLSEDSYFEFLKAALEKFPTTNGQKTLGLTFPGAEAWGIAGISGVLYEKGKYSAVAGNRSVIWDNDNSKFIDYMLNPYVKENLSFFNKLYRNGLFDPECFTDLLQQTTDKAIKGRPIAIWYTTWLAGSANAEFKKNGTEKMGYVNMPIMLKSQIDAKATRVTREIDTDVWSSMIITKNAKYPERIMQLLDWAAKEENQVLLGWGVEGEDYTVVNGKRVFTDAFKKKLLEQPAELDKDGIGWPYFVFLGLSSGLDKNGQCYLYQNDTAFQNLSLTDRQKEVYGHYGWETAVDPWAKNKSFNISLMKTGIISLSVVPADSDEGKLEEKMVQYRIKSVPTLILAKSQEDFDALWKKAVDGYNALNPEKVIAKYNEKYQANFKKLESAKSK